jgi:hypothetical protein
MICELWNLIRLSSQSKLFLPLGEVSSKHEVQYFGLNSLKFRVVPVSIFVIHFSLLHSTLYSLSYTEKAF